jgi:mannan endo-1,4-beta-mannosidase
MKKTLYVLALLSLSVLSFSAAITHPGFYTDGKSILSPCGEKVLLRGVNKMTVWTDKAGACFPEIAKTGANCVRIVWNTKDGTMDELDRAITACIKEKMIPIIELHDATCKWDMKLMDLITNYWTDKKMVSIIQKHEKYLMINYGNEIGDWSVSSDDYTAVYSAIIKKMRKSGIKVPIILDTPKCGQDTNVFYSASEDIIKADPDHNVIFSVHMWWPNDGPEKVEDTFVAAQDIKAPLIVAEFAHKGVGCSGAISYKAIIELSQKYGIGWLAWEWGPGNQDCAEMDMTKDGKYDTLWGWAKEVCVDSAYSIKNTSVRPKSVLEGSCN